MAIRMAPKPSKLEKQTALLTGKVPLKTSTKAAVTSTIAGRLPTMIKDAAAKLARASTAAEVLESMSDAKMAYEVAKLSGRIARAKEAHDKVVAAALRSQADALAIEAEAKSRLADEYDAGQKRGEVATRADQNLLPAEKKVGAADLGLTHKDIHEAREIRDVIAANPSAVKDALAQIIKDGDEPTRAALKKAIAPTVKAIRADATAEKKAKRVEREQTTAAKIRALPTKKYGVIVADPEWRFEPYSRETGMDRAADNHYSTTATDVIAQRDVASIAAPDCVLFLWATAPMIREALEVMAAWGFEYKSQAVWVKQRAGDGRGSGYWFLGEHELLLVGTRGSVPAPAPGTQFRSVIEAPAGEHSAKPERALEMIEAYFPNLPKIELNRRGPARSGWEAWGAEAE